MAHRLLWHAVLTPSCYVRRTQIIGYKAAGVASLLKRFPGALLSGEDQGA